MSEGRRSKADLIVELALSMFELGVSTESEPFAVPRVGARVVRMLDGGRPSLRAELAAAFFDGYDRVAGATAMTEALTTLEGMALRRPPTPLHLRVAWLEGRIWVDLGDETGRAVCVGLGGWEVVDRAPVLFKRTELTGRLPVPAEGGQLDALRGFLNVDGQGWALTVGWAVSAFFEETSHPILVLIGEQGTGKSSAARLLIDLIDPSPAPLRSLPRDERDFAVTASGSWLVCYDNASHVPPWLSDMLCRAVTGEGYPRRRLYSDKGITVDRYQRVLAITTIDMGTLRGDLADRAIFVTLERISGEQRCAESDLRARFEQSRPQLLGALLSLVSAALRHRRAVHLRSLPRMADHARILAAIDDVLPIGALSAFLSVHTRAMLDVVEGDPVAQAVRDLVYGSPEGLWEGTAAELLQAIVPERPDRRWPTTLHHLSGRLRSVAPALRATGVSVELQRTSRRRLIRIERLDSSASPPSGPSQSGMTNDAHDAESGPTSEHWMLLEAAAVVEEVLHGTVIDGPEAVLRAVRASSRRDLKRLAIAGNPHAGYTSVRAACIAPWEGG